MLIDATRADFIDLDIIEVIEDFMLHAPLKNITVELRKSSYKAQGFTIEKTVIHEKVVVTEVGRKFVGAFSNFAVGLPPCPSK